MPFHPVRAGGWACCAASASTALSRRTRPGHGWDTAGTRPKHEDEIRSRAAGWPSKSCKWKRRRTRGFRRQRLKRRQLSLCHRSQGQGRPTRCLAGPSPTRLVAYDLPQLCSQRSRPLRLDRRTCSSRRLGGCACASTCSRARLSRRRCRLSCTAETATIPPRSRCFTRSTLLWSDPPADPSDQPCCCFGQHPQKLVRTRPDHSKARNARADFVQTDIRRDACVRARCWCSTTRTCFGKIEDGRKISLRRGPPTLYTLWQLHLHYTYVGHYVHVTLAWIASVCLQFQIGI
mmetsp:Transcript_12869/g.29641  ORF Transcript_12869/g.29641 Transcript_12869/m.29641 type:complete len:290 (-) Transcript_12869:193-1062(-)